MTIPLPSLLVVAVASLAIASYLFFMVIPRSNRSLFRYDLWKLRDDVVDDVLAGRLPDSRLTQEFIASVETTICAAPSLSLVKWILLPTMPKPLAALRRESVQKERARLTPDQLRLFDEYQTKFRDTFTHHMICASASGWLAFLFVVAVLLLVGIVKMLHHGATSPARYARHVLKSIRDQKIANSERIWVLRGSDIAMSPLPLCIN
jgi:hypothetical protein